MPELSTYERSGQGRAGAGAVRAGAMSGAEGAGAALGGGGALSVGAAAAAEGAGSAGAGSPDGAPGAAALFTEGACGADDRKNSASTTATPRPAVTAAVMMARRTRGVAVVGSSGLATETPETCVF